MNKMPGALASILALSSFFGSASLAQTSKIPALLSGVPGTLLKLGSPAALLAGLEPVEGKDPTVYTFVSNVGEPIPVTIENYYFKDGQLSMTGKAQGSKDSSFIFKGNAQKLYGWVVLKDRNLAFEYTTDAGGNVVATQVPVTKIYPICNIQYTGHASKSAEKHVKTPGLARHAGPEPHIGEYDGSDVNKLQSLPGSTRVMYLDITDIMNGEEPITLSSKEEMWKMWQSVASGYSMFDLNVTTDASIYDATPVTNTAKACFYNQDGRSNSPLNAWGTSQCSTNYKNVEQGYGLGRTALHETGHTMGMSHDGGQPGGEYYEGIPEFQWCPIMGNYWFGNNWDEALYQWSIGEYSGANNDEDDLEIINSNLPYRADDIPDTVPLMLSGTMVSAENNRGQIAEVTDSDTFTFEVGASGGHATLKVNRTEYLGGGMLDVDAELQDASGASVQQSNVKAARYAELDVDLPAGQYKLVIKAGTEGTPSDGFSTFSSLGFYAIEGTIEGGMGTGGVGGMGGGGGMSGSGGVAGTSGAGGTAGAGGSVGGAAGVGGASGMGGSAGTAGTAGTAGKGGAAGSGGAGAGGAAGVGGGAGVSGGAGMGTAGGGADDSAGDDGCACSTAQRAPSGMALLAFGGLALALVRRRAPRA